jgi:hypothetical protein
MKTSPAWENGSAGESGQIHPPYLRVTKKDFCRTRPHDEDTIKTD